jgi:hypothetical protein
VCGAASDGNPPSWLRSPLSRFAAPDNAWSALRAAEPILSLRSFAAGGCWSVLPVLCTEATSGAALCCVCPAGASFPFGGGTVRPFPLAPVDVPSIVRATNPLSANRPTTRGEDDDGTSLEGASVLALERVGLDGGGT